jgi:hypothetical protein
MTRKALARRIAELLFNEPATRRGAGADPTRRAARILAGCLVASRSKTTAGMLPCTPVRLGPPRTQPKFAAALLYEPQTWCTMSQKNLKCPLHVISFVAYLNNSRP